MGTTQASGPMWSPAGRGSRSLEKTANALCDPRTLRAL